MLQLPASFNFSQIPDMFINIQSKVFTVFQCGSEFDIIKVLMAVKVPADDISCICRILSRRQQACSKRRKKIYQLQMHNTLKYLNLIKTAVRSSNSGQC
jgi:hypothetical protein